MELLGPFCKKQIWQFLAGPGLESGVPTLLKLTQVSWDDRWLPAHQLDSEELLKPWRVESSSSRNQRRAQRSSIQGIMQILRNTLSAPESPQNANDVNPANKRHCIMMAAGTKPGGFNGQKKIVLIGEKHQSLSLTSFRLFSPTHPSSVPRDDRTTSLFPPSPA